MSCFELRSTLEADGKNDCFDNSPVAKEGGKRFAFANTSRKTICRVRVDNCLIADNQKKCDFLFKVLEVEKYYLVELKGVNVEDGIQQIISTYNIVNRKIKASPDNFNGIIVSSSIPASAHQRFRKLQEKCYRDTKILIKKKHIEHIEPI
jgi:hypothetical protein